MEHNGLKFNKPTMTYTEVAKSYFGASDVLGRMSIFASLSIRLSKPAIEPIGKLMNAEHPDLYKDISGTIEGNYYNEVNNDQFLFAPIS